MRRDISFKALCAIATRERYRAETTDEIEWKERVRTKVIADGYRSPRSSVIYQAIEAVKFVSRKQRQPVPPLARRSSPSSWSPVSSLCPTPPANACGCLKRVSGAKSLRCTRERDHDGEHGVHSHGLLIVRWSR